MKVSGNDLFVTAMKKEGVDTIFAYPGGMVVNLLDALHDCHGIDLVLPRHEQGLIHAADGYARATGKVGVCLVTSGPGATNLVTGIATANYDSIPLVCFTGQVPEHLIGNDAFQEVDIIGVTRNIAKFVIMVRDREMLAQRIKEAFYIARSGKPGPVLVDLPTDVMAELGSTSYPTEVNIRGYKPNKGVHVGQLKKAINLLEEAKKPMFLIGGGVNLAHAQEEMTKLAEKIDAPVITTVMGRGAISTEHPLYIGNIGMHGSYAANKTADECDLMFSIGCRFNDRVTGEIKKFAPNAKIVHIDIDPASISKTVNADIPIVGDAKTVLNQFIDAFNEFDLKENETAMKQWWAEIEKWRHIDCLNYRHDENLIQPQEIIEAVYKATDGKAIIATDVGQHQMFTALYYKFDEPRHLLTSGGLGTMGYGFPAAIGAKVGEPDKEVCLFTGDGSFQMNIQELSTCLEFGIPLKIFILDNHTLGMVRQWQKMFYHGHISSTNLNSNPDFIALAKAYGHEGIRIEDPKDLETGVKKALAMKDKLVIVDIVCNTDAKVLPMQQMGGSMSDMFLNED